jgi:F-type H+-transporting ATPase subunit delta
VSQGENKQNEIAKRYGGVLFELASERDLVEHVLKDVHRLLKCLHQDRRAWSFISSPIASPEVQLEVLKKLNLSLETTELTSQFLTTVGRNHRLAHLAEMLEEYIVRCKGALGVMEGVLETAVALPAQALDKIQKVLTKRLGKEVVLQTQINKALLGGVTLRLGSLMVDASLETRLNKLRDMLKD